MNLLYPPRDRADYLRPVTQPPRRSRRVEPVKPAPGVWSIKPDTWAERMDAWLWRYPLIHGIAMVLLIGGLMGSLIYLTLKVARMEP